MMSGVSAKLLVIEFLHLMNGIILDLYLLMSYYRCSVIVQTQHNNSQG